jgi:hypothetical protein
MDRMTPMVITPTRAGRHAQIRFVLILPRLGHLDQLTFVENDLSRGLGDATFNETDASLEPSPSTVLRKRAKGQADDHGDLAGRHP